MNVPFRRQLAGGLKRLLYARHGQTPGTGVRVLEYHYIDSTGSPLSVSPSEFRKHLEILREGGWRALTPAEYLQRLSIPVSKPGTKEVFITFDDGHESFARIAVPLLLEFGFTATVFVITDLIGKTAKWFDRDQQRIAQLLGSFAFNRRERTVMKQSWGQFAVGKLSDAEELSQLGQSGFGIECHTCLHRFLTELNRQELMQELHASRRWLREHLGIDSRILCYPYGDWNAEVAEAAAAAGFEAAMLSEFTAVAGNRFAIGRLPLGGSGNVFALRFGLSQAADVLAEIREKKKFDSAAKFMTNPCDPAITEVADHDGLSKLRGTQT